MILVSGIPGSGKTKLSEQICGQLKLEGIKAGAFKMPTVEDSIKYNTEKFIQAMIEFKKQSPESTVVVAVIPSYHHLKKAVFELKKSSEYSQVFEIKQVITKVHARNFYMNKNRNTYQFLVENCMKGVTQAVIFEKSNVSQGEVEIIQRCLENANFKQNVMVTHGKSFSLEDLATILCNENEKLSVIYNKFFYGFEKEGKSQYFLEKSVQGAYFT